jgi:hypothetical protein
VARVGTQSCGIVSCCTVCGAGGVVWSGVERIWCLGCSMESNIVSSRVASRGILPFAESCWVDRGKAVMGAYHGGPSAASHPSGLCGLVEPAFVGRGTALPCRVPSRVVMACREVEGVELADG